MGQVGELMQPEKDTICCVDNNLAHIGLWYITHFRHLNLLKKEAKCKTGAGFI